MIESILLWPVNELCFVIADVDECLLADVNICDSNAMCTNTQGSYVCRCLRGYQGDGLTCEGEY